MKPVTFAALLPIFTLAATAPAITLAPGQTATPDFMTLPGPNEVSINSGANATPLFPPPSFGLGTAPIGHFASGLFQNTLTNNYTFSINTAIDPALPLTSISFPGYKGYTVDAGYRNSVGFVPSTVSRSADGDVITYTFTTHPLIAGETNMVLRTDASKFVITYENTITFTGAQFPNGAVSTTISALAPAPIPEISSLSALLCASTGLLFRFRRTR